MPKIYNITEGKTHLPAIVRDAAKENITIVRHGHPAAVVLSTARFDNMVAYIEDLEDRITVLTADRNDTVPWEKIKADHGL
jgi:prevent-host-death family protein